MKLSTMKRIMDTVDENWKSPLGEQILKKWGYDEGTVFILRASANFVFEFKNNGSHYYLRFNESTERDLISLEAEIHLLRYLEKSSVKVVRPVKSLTGSFIEIVETDLGKYYAIVFEALEGKQFEIEELSRAGIFGWGKTLGRLHQELKNLTIDYLDRPSWEFQLLNVKEVFIKSEYPVYKAYLNALKWAGALDKNKENYGLIHYDFELDNLIFGNDELSVLDFDDSCFHWYAADIVFALRELGSFDLKNSITSLFIEGYKTETLLSIEILKEIKGFEQLHRLTSIAKITRSLDIEESPSDPEWLRNLRNKLSHKLDEYRQLLIDVDR